MDWVSILLSLGIFGVILAFMIERIWKAYETSRDRQNFLRSIKKELEECHSLLKGEGNLLPTDLWKAGISAGLLKLIPYENEISLAKVYFGIECHNYEAEKVRDVSILAATTKVPKDQYQYYGFGTAAKLLHYNLSKRQKEEEKELRKDIDELLRQDIWD